MTQHTSHGITFTLITGDELAELVDQIADRFGPNWPDDGTKRLVMDTLNSCQHFIEHYEGAARVKAGIAPHQRAVADLIADLHSGKALGIPQDDDEPARLRGKGAI